MSLLLCVLLAVCCFSPVFGGFLVTTVETDLVKGNCSANGTGIHMNHWAEGVSYSNVRTDEGFLAIEFNGHTAHCCRVAEVDYENEYPCTTPPPLPPKCPSGFEEFEGSCFYFSVKSLGWEDAKKSCELLDSNLARPGQAEDFFIIGSIKNTGQNFWFDLNDRETDEMVFTNSSEPSFTHWAEGEPNNRGFFFTDEDCVAYDHDKDYMWNDMDCDDEQRFICQRPLE